MRVKRALLVGISVLTVSLGTTTATEAMGWERPWAAHTHNTTLPPVHSDGNGKGKTKGEKEKGGKYLLFHSCKGKFDYCTKKAIFAPKILGDIGLTTGLIGLTNGSNGTNGQNGTNGTNGQNGSNGTNGTNGMNGTNGTNGTTGTNTPPPPPSHWCSPGYWRQDHHLDSWEATGYSPDDNFAQATGVQATRTNQGENQGAPTNPTLFEVVDNPQWYGGDDTNRVADLLSANHPDVNYDPPPFRQNALPCPLN